MAQHGDERLPKSPQVASEPLDSDTASSLFKLTHERDKK